MPSFLNGTWIHFISKLDFLLIALSHYYLKCSIQTNTDTFLKNVLVFPLFSLITEQPVALAFFFSHLCPIPSLCRSTPQPLLPPLHCSVCIFVRFALLLPLYPLISSLNKRHGQHARTQARTHRHARTNTANYFTRKRHASKHNVQTYTAAQEWVRP